MPEDATNATLSRISFPTIHKNIDGEDETLNAQNLELPGPFLELLFQNPVFP